MKRYVLSSLLFCSLFLAVNAASYDGIDREIIPAGRNLGIGTNNPQHTLEVNGEASFETSIVLKEIAAPSQEASYGTIYTGTDSNLYFLDDSGVSFLLNDPTPPGGPEWSDQGTYLHPGDNSGAETLVIGATDINNGDIILGSTGSSVINEQGLDSDFRVEGTSDPYLFFTDASTDYVGIGYSTPSTKLDVNGTVTAEFFVGDGSSLTGLPAPNVSPFVISSNIISNNGSADYADDFIIGASSLENVSGSNNVMFFDKSKGAFRAGTAYDAYWDDANRGNYSAAFGYQTRATGTYSTAWNQLTQASGDLSTAWGYNTIASASKSTAWGDSSRAKVTGATAWGYNTLANGAYSTAWGINTEAKTGYSTAWGNGTLASGMQSTAWGLNTQATGNSATAWGEYSSANGLASVAFGAYVAANSDYSITIGKGNSSADKLSNSTTNSLIIGFNSNAATLFIGSSAGGSTTANVGIGTSSPSEKLEVNGITVATGFYDKALVTTTVSVDTATVVIDWTQGSKQLLNLDGNITTLNFTNPPGPGNVTLIIVNNAASAKSIATVDTDTRWAGGSYSGVTAATNAIDIISCVFEGSGGRYFCNLSTNYQT